MSKANFLELCQDEVHRILDRSFPPLRLRQPADGLLGTRRGPDHLVCLTGSLREGILPCPAISALPGGVGGDPRYRVNRHGLLTVIIIGLLLIPLMIVLSVVPFVHMAYAAYKVRGWTTAIPSWRTSSGAAAGAVLYRRTKVGIPGDPH